ncbi:hypothetical protein [Niabella drilacis]|uniref:Uncharacterized protein n=1 Tax=Niabella drilacis (strain DSM 25811 / CCM 8410 / CCUG 62505 / LMG 26954 / E90) TaxID=1285928 RepID=A0A1G6YDG2_NIADE|nr:hypothetical protein [Niabella drilacis]SDD88400.1 hypothetical protein SAMN04487894_11579 [Niabella drilacis]
MGIVKAVAASRARMNLAALAVFITLCCGCSSSNFMPLKSKTFVREDFPERFFFDTATNTGFNKRVYGFKYIDRRSLARLKKTRFFKQLKRYKDHLIPVYAATRSNEEALPEYLLVFKIRRNLPINGYLSTHFRKIELYRRAGGNRFNKKRLVQTYYSHDPVNKWIASAEFVSNNADEASFLVLGFLPYSDRSKILDLPVSASRDLYEKHILEDSSATYGYGLRRYGADTILQIRGFWYIGPVSSSLKNADQFVYHNYFKIADSAFAHNGILSYAAPVNILKNWDKTELEQSDDVYSYSNHRRSLSTYLSFLGLHKAAVEDSSIKGFSYPRGYSIVPADQYILDQIADRKIIAFNDLGYDVRNRAFLFHLLDSLKKRGFTHLAIEDLHKKFRANRISIKSGFHVREPVLHNLIEYAGNIGIKVTGYDLCSSCTDGERNKAAARYLVRKARIRSGHKLLILANAGNIGKSKKGASPNTLADYLHYYSQQEVFTIAQAFEKWSYLKDSLISNYYVLSSDTDGHSYRPNNLVADVNVFPPTTLQYFDYDFYYQNRLLPLNKFTFHYTAADAATKKEVTLYLYKSKKRKSRNSPLPLPLFVKQLENKSQEVNIYSAYKGKSYIEVRDDTNTLLFSRELAPRPE